MGKAAALRESEIVCVQEWFARLHTFMSPSLVHVSIPGFNSAECTEAPAMNIEALSTTNQFP